MKHDDTTLQAAIDAAMIEIGNTHFRTNLNLIKDSTYWGAEPSSRLALAKAFLVKLPEPQPILADDGRSLGLIAHKSYLDAGGVGLVEKWEAAAQAVASVVLDQAIRRMAAVSHSEITNAYWQEGDGYENIRARLITAARGEKRPLMTKNIPGDKCPLCGAEEVESNSPNTVYACGSSDYDGRPETFHPGDKCEARIVGINGLTEAEEAQTASVAGLSKPDSADWKARAEKAEAALAESEKQFQAKVTELLETLGRAEKAEKEVELLKKVPLRQMVQQREREVDHWCDLHAVTYNRAEKAEAELAAIKSSQIGILRPLAEAGPVPDGCVRMLGNNKTDGKWTLATWEDEYDTHFADIRIPSTETPAQTVNEQPNQQVPLGPEDVMPGSVFRSSHEHWFQVIHKSHNTVSLMASGTSRSISFKELKEENWQINRSIPLTGKWDANAWEPCSKPGK